MRIFIFGLLLILVPPLSLAQDIPKNNQRYGGTLIWGERIKPTIINPILTTHSVSMSLLDIIFNRLVRLDSKGEIEPDLAESWNISPDGLVYTFYLRKGVRFHDGKECTAFDVKFTYDKIVEPRIKSPFRSSFEIVEEFKAPDKYTFQVVLKRSSNTFIYRLLREIAPKHLLEKVDLQNCSFNYHPIGTGPFRFKEWRKDDQITLEYNPDYYAGRPYLDKFIVKIYPDLKDVWVALMRSEIDYGIFLEREDYEIMKEDPAFKTYAFPIDSYYAIFYNPDDVLLADKRIREAIAYGIDRKALIRRIDGGYGLECNGPFYPENLGFNPAAQAFAYNPDKSKELLAQAGWLDTDGDGILERNGEKLELRVLVDTRNNTFKRIAMFIRQQFQEIGIKFKVLLYNNEKEMTPEFLEENKPQAQLKLFGGRSDRDDVRYHWSYKDARREDKIWVYKSEEVTKLFELGETIQDKEKRKQIYQQIHKIVYEDQPACFLYFPYYFYAVSARFQNTDAYFSLNMPTYTIKDWYITEAKIERR
jgi:peptide/nickel transport system substrate-binding protein